MRTQAKQVDTIHIFNLQNGTRSRTNAERNISITYR